MTPELIEVRKKLYSDFDFYAKHCLKIRTKEGSIEPFKLNPAQKILQEAIDTMMAEKGYVRIIILKGRQQGLSTHVGGYMYSQVSQNSARKAMVVTHHADSTEALFDMTKRYHDNMPEWMKPHTKYSSKKELFFDLLDSGYMVSTAGGKGIGRGETLNYVHGSEVAFWNPSTAKANWNGLVQAVPVEGKGTAIFAESTANGVSGLFYDLWQGAVDGTNGYMPVFIPWFIQEEYRRPVPEDFVRTPQEEDLVEAHGLDDEQLMFRRFKVAENGLDLFKQEYPCTADEAFLTSGRPVFNPEQLVELAREAPNPLYTMNLEGDVESLKGEWRENPRGPLKVYEEYDPQETYYIGGDPAEGVRGGDYSIAQVLDSKKRQVAIYRDIVHPDYFAQILYHLGERYNMAKTIVEANNHGILTCTRLGKDYAYPNFYIEEVYDKQRDVFTERLGFTTSVKTKPLIIDELRASVRDEELLPVDHTTIQEMLTYIVTETGKMEAEQGCFDDTVIALALVNHIHEGKFEVIDNQETYYIEMV